MNHRWIVAAALCLGLAGCSAGSSGQASRPPLSERQRDSILARSNLPGAGAVGSAMRVTDAQASQAAATNAQVDSLPR